MTFTFFAITKWIIHYFNLVIDFYSLLLFSSHIGRKTFNVRGNFSRASANVRSIHGHVKPERTSPSVARTLKLF